jgi:hypothetical protein
MSGEKATGRSSHVAASWMKTAVEPDGGVLTAG